MKHFLFLTSITAIIFLFSPLAMAEEATALASAPGPAKFYEGSDVPNINITKQSAISTLLPNFSNTFAQLVAAVAVVFLIIAGIQYLIAVGNPEGVTKAHKMIMWIILGLGLVLFAYTLVSLFLGLFGT
jgi:hypothetical protein